MKRKETVKFLQLFDQEDKKSNDYSQFEDPQMARDQLENLVRIKNALNSQENAFSPFFTEKVMGRIIQLTNQQGIGDYLGLLFYRVATYGLSAVAIAVLTLYLLHGQDGFSSVISSDSSNELNFISSLFYEY